MNVYRVFATIFFISTNFRLSAQPTQKDTLPFICKLPYETPQFPGGDDSLRSYLRRNRRCPGPKWEWEGTIFVRFKIDCKGEISDASVLRGHDSLADKEALRLVNAMPKWTKVNCDTQPQPFWYNLPIYFRRYESL